MKTEVQGKTDQVWAAGQQDADLALSFSFLLVSLISEPEVSCETVEHRG